MSNELKEIFIVEGYYTENSPAPLFGDCLGYGKEEVDALLAKKNAEIESLKASHYAEMVDAGMRERRLRRALYKACAMWADRTRLICSVFGSNEPKIRWERMLDKCRAMAERYMEAK